jgi:hypothetical protein
MLPDGQVRLRLILAPLVLLALVGCATMPLRPSPTIVAELVEATTADGVRLAGGLWIPALPDWKRPALLLVHGYAGNFY